MKRYFKAFGYLLSVHVLALLVMTLFRLVEFIALHGMIWPGGLWTRNHRECAYRSSTK